MSNNEHQDIEKIRSRVYRKYAPVDRPKRITLKNLYEHITLRPRDKQVLLSLYYHRCMTSKQIAEIHFAYDEHGKPNSQAEVIARRRLRKMYEAQLVKRYFFDAPQGQGTVPGHYVLTGLGARVVAGMLNQPLSEISWKHEFSVITASKLPYLAHSIGITDFYIYLLRSARAHGHKVREFITEQHVRHEVPKLKGRGKYIVQPDAYGQYWLDDVTYVHFFLEWDNGTMTPNQFRKKYNRYLAFYASKELEENYGEIPPYILVVTPDDERAIRLRNTMYLNRKMPMVWLFTSKERVKDNFLGKIWLGAEEKPISLL